MPMTQCVGCKTDVRVPIKWLYVVGAVILFPLGLLFLCIPGRIPCPKCGKECRAALVKIF